MNFKKIISVSICSAMLVSLVGCTGPKEFFSNIINGNQNNNSNNVQLSEKVNKDAVFKETGDFSLEGFEYIDSLTVANDRFYAITVQYEYPEGYYDDEGEDEVILFDDEETEETSEPADETTEENKEETDEVDTTEEETDDYADETDFEEYDGIAPGLDADVKTKVSIASFTSGNDISYKEFEGAPSEYPQGGLGVDAQGNYYIAFASWNDLTGEQSFSLKKYSETLELVKEVPITTNDQYFYVRNVFTDKEGNSFVVSDSSVEIYDKDLNKIGTFKPDSEAYMSSATLNSEGKLSVMVANWSSEEYQVDFYIVDNKGNTTEDNSVSSMLSGKEIISGNGYDYYYRTTTSVYGFNKGDKKAVEVVNFYDSDIDPNTVYGQVVFIDKDHFISVNTDEECKIVTYEKVPAADVKDKEVITLGTVYGSYSVSKQILEFNKNNDAYRIKLLDYSEYDTPEDWNAGLKRFNTDLTGGNAPDIIIPEASQVQNLIGKGVFADLTPYMEEGPGLKKDDLVNNAKTIFADGDKLYCVFPSFSIEAIEVKKSNYKENMTIQDVIAWENKTGNKAFSEMTKGAVLSQFMSLGMDAFLDPKTGKCNFNSQQFMDVLDYANTYPLEFDENYWNNYDYTQYVNIFRSEGALFNVAYINNFRDYNWTRQYRFGEETVLMGMPVEGSAGAMILIDSPMAISSKSKKKEVAWEFINSCFSSSYYEKEQWSIPSVESELDRMIEESCERPYYEDDAGKKVYYDETYWLIDHEETVKPLTKEEAAAIKDFVVNVHNVYSWDTELNSIVDEETQGYFQGQKTSKEVADVIQSRLQIYINEKK